MSTDIHCEDPTFRKDIFATVLSMQLASINQSYYKYGAARDNFASGRVDALGSADLCLEKFKKTKNAEYLVDVMNYILFRIMFPLPGDYMARTNSDESAGTVGVPIKMEN